MSAYAQAGKYDPLRNPDADLAAALAEAKRSHRNVLIEVGGEWCVWCHIVDRFYADHPDLLALREQTFVIVKVNFSRENFNKLFLSRYPKIAGYPHLFVLDADGKLLQSQNTSELEEGKSYNLQRFTQFLERYSPKASPANSN